MVLLRLLLAVLAISVIWFLSGMLIEATDRVARRYNRPGFFVAFFILGFLTSVSEMSVAINSTIQGVPQVSAGNLVGASFVIFLLIIPLLTITANGIPMQLTLRKHVLGLLLLVVLLPSLFALDGDIHRTEGLIMLVLYGTLVFAVRKREPVEETVKEAVGGVKKELLNKRYATLIDIGKISVGALLIFLAGKILVDEAVFFSHFLRVPPSFIGLMVLSIGTNVPELAITLRAVLGKRDAIAFGDYLGSAAANTCLFGLLSLANGPFGLESSEFIPTFLLFVPGLILYYLFSISRGTLSRKEGLFLLAIYGLFLILQLVNITQIVPTVQGAAAQVLGAP